MRHSKTAIKATMKQMNEMLCTLKDSKDEQEVIILGLRSEIQEMKQKQQQNNQQDVQVLHRGSQQKIVAMKKENTVKQEPPYMNMMKELIDEMTSENQTFTNCLVQQTHDISLNKEMTTDIRRLQSQLDDALQEIDTKQTEIVVQSQHIQRLLKLVDDLHEKNAELNRCIAEEKPIKKLEPIKKAKMVTTDNRDITEMETMESNDMKSDSSKMDDTSTRTQVAQLRKECNGLFVSVENGMSSFFAGSNSVIDTISANVSGVVGGHDQMMVAKDVKTDIVKTFEVAVQADGEAVPFNQVDALRKKLKDRSKSLQISQENNEKLLDNHESNKDRIEELQQLLAEREQEIQKLTDFKETNPIKIRILKSTDSDAKMLQSDDGESVTKVDSLDNDNLRQKTDLEVNYDAPRESEFTLLQREVDLLVSIENLKAQHRFEIRSANAERDSAKASSSTMEDEPDKILKTKIIQIGTLQREKKELQVKADRSEELLVQVGTLRKKLNAQSKLLEVLHDEKVQMDALRKTKDSDIERLITMMSANKRTMDDLRERNRKMEAKILAQKEQQRHSIEMKGKSDAERRDTEEHETQIFADREESEVRIERLNSDLDDARTQLQEQRAPNEAQRKELNQKSEIHEKLLAEQKWTAKQKKNGVRIKQMDTHSEGTDSKLPALESNLDDTRKDVTKERAQNESYLHQRAVAEKKLIDDMQKRETLGKSMSDLQEELVSHRTEMDNVLENAALDKKQLNDELSHTIMENIYLKIQIDTLKKETSAEIEQLRSTLDEQKEAYKHLHHEVLSMETEKKKFQNQWDAEVELLSEQSEIHRIETDSAFERLKSDLDELRGDAAKATEQLNIEIKSKMRENDNLKNQIDCLRQENASNIGEIHSTIDANQMEIDNLKERTQELRQKLSVEMEKSEALQTKMDLHQEEMDKEIQRLKSDLDDSRRELSDRQIEMELVQEKLVMKRKESIEMKKSAKSEIEEKNDKFEALVAAKAAAIKKVESDLLGMEKMNSQLTEDNGRKQEAIESKLAIIGDTKDTESLKHQTAEFMQMKLELDASRQELADKNTDVERLQTVRDEMRADLEKLNETNRDHQNSSSTTNAKSMDQKVVDLEYLLSQRDEEIEKLKESIHNLREENELEAQRMKREWDDHLRNLVTQHQELVEDHIDIHDAAIKKLE